MRFYLTSVFLGNLESEDVVWKELFPLTPSFHFRRAPNVKASPIHLVWSRTGTPGWERHIAEPAILTSHSAAVTTQPRLLRLLLAVLKPGSSQALPQPQSGEEAQTTGPWSWHLCIIGGSAEQMREGSRSVIYREPQFCAELCTCHQTLAATVSLNLSNHQLFQIKNPRLMGTKQLA